MLEKDPEKRINMFKIMNHKWFDLKDKDIEEVNKVVDLDQTIDQTQEQSNAYKFLSSSFSNNNVEEAIIPKFSKPTTQQANKIDSKRIVHKLKRKMTIKPSLNINSIKLPKRKAMKISKDDISDYSNKIKLTFNSPVSSGHHNLNRSVEENKNFFKSNGKKSNRIIINDHNFSSIQNSYGNKDFKSLQPKSSYPINNSFNKKEDMSPAIEFNFKEYIDSRRKTKPKDIKIMAKFRARSFLKKESGGDQYLQELYTRFPEILVHKPKII